MHDEKQTEILEQGPMIKVEEAEGFLAYFESIVPELEMVVISGSLPKGLDTNYYSYILDICIKHNVSVVVNCSSKALFEVLKGNAKPIAIKPNAEELYQLLGVKVTDNVNDMKKMLQN
ncbi:tagatose 6-phosphate kinase [Enterococcus sp. DIV1420a]